MTTNELTAVLEGALRSHAEKAFGIEQMVAIIAAIIALGALYVAYQARKDSEKSAAAAEKSAEAAQRSTEIMARQLELATAEQNRTLQKDRSDSYPFFHWGSGSYSPYSGKCSWQFQNMGATVTNIEIQTDEKAFTATINPKETLLTNAHGNIEFGFERKTDQHIPLPVNFKISCTTKLGERWETKYQMQGSAAPQRIVISS